MSVAGLAYGELMQGRYMPVNDKVTMKAFFLSIMLFLVFDAGLGEVMPDRPLYEGTIVVAPFGDATRPWGFTQMIEAYKQYQPKVKISLELKGAGLRTETYRTWLNTQLASGDPRPDIVSGNYSKAYTGYVNFDLYRKVINPYTGNPWNIDYDFTTQRERNVKGEFYCLATESVQVMWYYNKDIFKELGLEVPKTWGEFMAVCQKCKEAGYVPLTLRFNWKYWQWLSEILWDQYSRPYVNVVRAQPGDWCFDPSIDGVWKYDPSDPFNDSRITVSYARMLKGIRDADIRFNTPEFIAFLKNFKEIVQYCPSSFFTGEKDLEGEYNMFLKQQAVMHLDLSRLMFEIEKDLAKLGQKTDKATGKSEAFQWGTFLTPGQTNDLVKGPIRNVESAAGVYLCVLKKNQYQTDMVMDFIMFWLSQKGTQAFYDGQVAMNDFRPAGPLFVQNVKLPERAEAIFSKIVRRGDAESYGLNNTFSFPIKGSPEENDAKKLLVDYLQSEVDEAYVASEIEKIMKRAVAGRISMAGIDPIFIDHPELDPGKY